MSEDSFLWGQTIMTLCANCVNMHGFCVCEDQIPLQVCRCWLKLLSFARLQISSLILSLFFMCKTIFDLFCSSSSSSLRKENKTSLYCVFPLSSELLSPYLTEFITLLCDDIKKIRGSNKHFLWMLISLSFQKNKNMMINYSHLNVIVILLTHTLPHTHRAWLGLQYGHTTWY